MTTDTFGIASRLASLGGGRARHRGTAFSLRIFPCREIASDHLLERIDLGAHQLVQARLDRGIERRKAIAPSEGQLPGAGALEKVTGAVSLLLLEPVHEVARPSGDARESRQIVYRVDQFAIGGGCGHRVAIDADEIANAVEMRLRIDAEVVVEQDQHAIVAKARAILGQMGGITAYLDHLRHFFEKHIERIEGQRVVTPEFVGGVDALDGIAKGADDFASRNMPGDALGGYGEAEVGIDLANWTHAVGVAKMIRVPLDTFRVVGGEKIGLLDSRGQIDAALQHFVQPGGTGAAGANADEIR